MRRPVFHAIGLVRGIDPPAVLGPVLAMLGAPQAEWLPLTLLGFGALILLAPTVAGRMGERGSTLPTGEGNRVD